MDHHQKNRDHRTAHVVIAWLCLLTATSLCLFIIIDGRTP